MENRQSIKNYTVNKFHKMGRKNRLILLNLLTIFMETLDETRWKYIRPKSKSKKIKDINVKKHTRLNEDQLKLLVDYMVSHPAFSNNQELGYESKVTTRIVWNNLAEKINGQGPPVKTVEQLKDAWKNMKLRVRDKLQNIALNQRTTGNPPPVQELNDNERKIAELTGVQTTLGVAGVSPSGFGPNPSLNSTMVKDLVFDSSERSNEALSAPECNKQDNSSSTSLKYLKPCQKRRRPTVREASYLSESGISTASKISNISQDYVNLKKEQLVIHERIAVALEKIAGIVNEPPACGSSSNISDNKHDTIVNGTAKLSGDNNDKFDDEEFGDTNFTLENETAEQDNDNNNEFDDEEFGDTNFTLENETAEQDNDNNNEFDDEEFGDTNFTLENETAEQHGDNNDKRHDNKLGNTNFTFVNETAYQHGDDSNECDNFPIFQYLTQH